MVELIRKTSVPRGNSRQRDYGSVSSMGVFNTDDEFTPDSSLTVFQEEAPTITPDDLTSDMSTLINLIKGFLGVGSLALPQAFLYGGLWLASATLPVFAIISVHCLHLLLSSSRELRKRSLSALTYQDTVHAAFSSGPLLTKKLAMPSKVTVRVLVVFTQLGFCCAFYQFVVDNIYQVVECSMAGGVVSHLGYSAMVIIPVMAVSCIRHLKTITYISVVSGCVQLLGTAIILYYCTKDISLSDLTDRPAVGEWENIPLFFGIASYCFESVGLVLPLENKMKHPEHFGGTFGILNFGLAVVTLVYFAIGFLGYVRYGNDTRGNITLNLPLREKLAWIVKVSMAMAMLLSIPLQLYVPVEVVLPFLSQPKDTPAQQLAREYFTRVVLVFSIFSLSAAIPNIGVFMSFIGAVGGITLALVFPPVIHLVTFWPPATGWKGRYVLTKAILIIGFGVMGFLTGTFTSLMAIAEVIKDPANSTQIHCV